MYVKKIFVGILCLNGIDNGRYIEIFPIIMNNVTPLVDLNYSLKNLNTTLIELSTHKFWTKE